MENTQRVRWAGTTYVVGGALWFLVAAAGTVLYGLDPPSGSAAFYLGEVAFALLQTLLLVGWFGILWSGALGTGWFGKVAFAIAAMGHLIFVLAEIHSLMLGELSMLLPVGALTSAIGILLTGIAVARAGVWQGWARWMPLLTGLYFWVAMFPFLVVSGGPNGFAIAGWGLARLALGLAMRGQAEETRNRGRETGDGRYETGDTRQGNTVRR
jgi:hypothetical protein